MLSFLLHINPSPGYEQNHKILYLYFMYKIYLFMLKYFLILSANRYDARQNKIIIINNTIFENINKIL